MKKALVVGLALLMSAAFVDGLFAESTTEKATKMATDAVQDKAKAPGEALKTETKEAVGDKAAPAPEKKDVATAKAKRAKGEVTTVDMAAKSMTIKGKTGDLTFDVANAKMKAEPKVGDKVLVGYREADGKMVARYVAIAKKYHKGHKKAAKEEAAPAEKPAAPQPVPTLPN